MDLFKLEPGLAIWTWITFGILFFILAKYVLPAIMNNLQEREDYIRSSVDKTAEAEKRLSEIENERQDVLNAAEAEADKLLSQVRQDAERLRVQLTDNAEKEARTIIEQAREQADREREAMLKELQSELADFVCTASEKVIGFSFVGEKERDLSRELVKEL
jgi:F-type H+-transporting ATPase subunit b